MHEAKTHLSTLVSDALAGDEIVLSRSGVPLARLVPVEQPSRVSPFGVAAGEIREMTDAEWEDSDRAVAALFEQ